MKKVMLAVLLMMFTSVGFSSSDDDLSGSGIHSTFHWECHFAETVENGDRIFLKARCDQDDGPMVHTSIRLRDLHNSNGQLTNGFGCSNATFHKSCRNIDIKGKKLYADCRDNKGNYITSKVSITSVHVKRGHLIMPLCE